jgi:hypothetical protein
MKIRKASQFAFVKNALAPGIRKQLCPDGTMEFQSTLHLAANQKPKDAGWYSFGVMSEKPGGIIKGSKLKEGVEVRLSAEPHYPYPDGTYNIVNNRVATVKHGIVTELKER